MPLTYLLYDKSTVSDLIKKHDPTICTINIRTQIDWNNKNGKRYTIKSLTNHKKVGMAMFTSENDYKQE